MLLLTTSYIPTSSMIIINAAGWLYAAPIWSWQTSTVFLSDGTLIGTHGGTRDCADKASKYKFIFMSTAMEVKYRSSKINLIFDKHRKLFFLSKMNNSCFKYTQ
jgi:hypothetical protein